MKKRRTRLRGTKTAAKSEQKKLISRIKELKENPKLLLPKTTPGTQADDVYLRVLKELEKPLITLSLVATRGNQIKTAKMLGINRNTLRKKIKDLDIDVVRGTH